MKFKKLLSIILSPLVLGSYSASAVRRIPNVVKDRVLKRENRNLSLKRRRSSRKKNKVVNHKVDKKKLKNRTKDKSPIVSFRDSFIKGSKRVGRFIKENPGKSTLAAATVVGAVALSDRLPDFFADDNKVFEQTRNYLIENAIREDVYEFNLTGRNTISILVDAYFWRFGGGFDDEIKMGVSVLEEKGINGFEEDFKSCGNIVESVKNGLNDKLSNEEAVRRAIESCCREDIDQANFLKNDVLSQKGFEEWKNKEFNYDNKLELRKELSNSKIAFDKIRDKYYSKYEDDLKSNPDLLVGVLVKELNKIWNEPWPIGNYSAFPHTVLRRLWDFFLMRGATTRQRKSAERILYNGKAEGYGSCWELANIVDWFCRKLGFERHNIIAYKLFPGIYHTFNFFVCNGKAYLADPLGGVMQVLELKNGSLHDSLKYFRRSQVNGIAPGYGDWYAVEQIEDNTYRTLGMMKMAKFFPNMSDGSRLFENSESCHNPYCRKHYNCDEYLNIEKLDTSDKSSFIVKDKFGNLALNDKNNIEFDSFSSPLFG